MSHNEAFWFIIAIATCSIPLGTFVAIKTVKKLTRPTTNALTRHSGDIELVDYIEPTQPLQTYHQRELDLFNSQYPTYERISYPPTFETGAIPPSYRNGTLPSYQSMDRYNIHCCLENENIINQDFILWLIIFLVIFLLIIILRKFYLQDNKVIPIK
uniref:Uncharacterized protein n=1 Tax=Russula abietina TaxID=482377 RepID=A0A2S0U3W0_9AGAM|nr:hypothetical protein [Russula abietina]AWB36110.1 hypothetical protein [Russula abietina]